MNGIFKANNPYNSFLLLPYAALLKLPLFLHPAMPAQSTADGALYHWMIHKLSLFAGTNPIVYSLLAFILIYLQAIGINKLVNNFRLMQKSNYLAGMSYLLISSLVPAWSQLSAVLIVNTLFIFVLSGIFRLYSSVRPRTLLFNSGLFAGLAVFFYYPAAFLLLIVFVGLAFSRPFRLPEWLIAIIGWLTPAYFIAAWLFLSNQWSAVQFHKSIAGFPHFSVSYWTIIAGIVLLMLFFVGILFIRQNMFRQVVQTRKNWYIIIVYFFIALIIPFLQHANRLDYWALGAIPLSFIAGAAFLYPERKWFGILFHWGMVLISVVIGYNLA